MSEMGRKATAASAAGATETAMSASTSMRPPAPTAPLPRRRATASAEGNSSSSIISDSPQVKRTRRDAATNERGAGSQVALSSSDMDDTPLHDPRMGEQRLVTSQPRQPSTASSAGASDLAAAHLSLQPASEAIAIAATFAISLNHTRFEVDRQHPFLNPNTLFFPSMPGAPPMRLDSGLEVPLHRYGHRPVLLLDYTHAARLRLLRRSRRKALQQQIACLMAEREAQRGTARLWYMRRLRAKRSSESTMDESDKTASTSSTQQQQSLPDAETIDALIRATGERRAAISQEVHDLHRELKTLQRVKQQCPASADHEGCVLMLPSPDTHEVRLCSGHHYRTVCFVGAELRDVLPGDGPVVQPVQHNAGIPEPLAAATSTASEVAKHFAWVNAELLGFELYQQNHAKGKARMQRGAAASTAEATLDDYLALPACEAAMYREWAIQKHNLLYTVPRRAPAIPPVFFMSAPAYKEATVAPATAARFRRAGRVNYVIESSKPAMLCLVRGAQSKAYTPLSPEDIFEAVQPNALSLRPSSFIAHQALMDFYKICDGHYGVDSEEVDVQQMSHGGGGGGGVAAAANINPAFSTATTAVPSFSFAASAAGAASSTSSAPALPPLPSPDDPNIAEKLNDYRIAQLRRNAQHIDNKVYHSGGGGGGSSGGAGVCHFFRTPGGCNRGSACPFLHLDKSGQPVATRAPLPGGKK